MLTLKQNLDPQLQDPVYKEAVEENREVIAKKRDQLTDLKQALRAALGQPPVTTAQQVMAHSTSTAPQTERKTENTVSTAVAKTPPSSEQTEQPEEDDGSLFL